MQTIRRRPASPVLSWASAGADQQYRVAVSNADTGERRTIYEGFQTECRLPADFRLSPDLLAFRVEARPVDEPISYVRWQAFTVIPRLGDDLDTPADDLLVEDPIPGAKGYRLIIRDARTRDRLVDVMRPTPRFLLPPGQLEDRTGEYSFNALIKGRWRQGAWSPITPAMIEAARARALRLIELPRVQTPRPTETDALSPPGRFWRLGEAGADLEPALLIAAPVSAQPALAPEPSPASVIASQWRDGKGGGAVEALAARLHAHGLKGLFLLDMFAGEVLGRAALKRLAGELADQGHDLGLLINPAPWRRALTDMAKAPVHDLVGEAMALFQKVRGAPARVVAFGPGDLTQPAMVACRDAGARMILADEDNRRSLPQWMRWRTSPFAAMDDLAVVPPGLLISTPAHARDRVVRHRMESGDALAASSAGQAARFIRQDGDGARLMVVSIDPLTLLMRRHVRSPARADDWNETARQQSAWAASGWGRAPEGFDVAEGFNEIRMDMLNGLIETLRGADLPSLDLSSALTDEGLRSLCEPRAAHEALIEHRRGSRVMRKSAVRRYDNAYRLALALESA